MMKKIETKIEGVYIIESDCFGDHRGRFMETYSKQKNHELGILNDFVQDNLSYSAIKGTFRGLHYQRDPYAQAKLVRCIKGKIIDVAVDLRNYYHKEAEGAIRYDDPDLKIDWGSLTDMELILSDKDKAAPSFKECNANYVYETNS